jgi:hypothetical protein
MHLEVQGITWMNRTSVLTMIAAMSLTVAVLDFSTSAQLAMPVIFAFPLALCARQRSKRLLWATMGIAVAESVAAGYFGFQRAGTNHWAGAVNRGLVTDSLLGLTVLFHLWISKNQNEVLEAGRRERHRLALIERNEYLETELTKIKASSPGKRKAKKKRTSHLSTTLGAPATKPTGTALRFGRSSSVRSTKDSESNGSTGGS